MDSVKYIGMDVHQEAISIAASSAIACAEEKFPNYAELLFESSPLKWLSTSSRLSGIFALVSKTEYTTSFPASCAVINALSSDSSW